MQAEERKMKILNSTEKKKILEQLEQFGIEKLNYLLFQTGKEKIRGYSGNLSIQEINMLARTIRVEIIGLYLFKQDLGLRLSLDATQILKPSKKIINTNDIQAQSWLKGEDLNITTNQQGFVIIKHNQDFLGSGKSAGNLILNFIPKERRLK